MDVKALFSADRARELDSLDPDIISTVRQAEAPPNRRFEGFYGRLYSRVIQTPTLRRAVFSLWGSAAPLYRLEAFVEDAVRAAEATSPVPVLVDLPSGSGTLLPFLARSGFKGTVVEIDLAISMLRRALDVHRATAPDVEAAFIQGDALDLPLRDAVADAVVSINGLHVVPDHARFLAEVARITKPGGPFWLITPVAGPSMRSRSILRAAGALGITPGRPPTSVELRHLLAAAGFREIRSYGGASITGLACVRVGIE